MKLVLMILTFFLIGPAVKAQAPADPELTNLQESGYRIYQRGRDYEINVALILSNPFESKFASYPKVHITIKASDGSIITAREVNGAGIPPKGKIAICETIDTEVKPASVTFRPLKAGYEETTLRPGDFREFIVSNVRARASSHGSLRITGEITNPYSKEMGAWVCLLLRDKQGKLLGGVIKHFFEAPAGDPFAFEMELASDALPAELGSYDKMAFSHFNYQDSWLKVFGKEKEAK